MIAIILRSALLIILLCKNILGVSRRLLYITDHNIFILTCFEFDRSKKPMENLSFAKMWYLSSLFPLSGGSLPVVYSRVSLFSLKLVKYFARVSFHSPREILAPAVTSYSIQFGSTRLDSKGSLIKFLPG